MTITEEESERIPTHKGKDISHGPLSDFEKRVLVDGGGFVPVPGLIQHLQKILGSEISIVCWTNGWTERKKPMILLSKGERRND